MRPFTVIFDSCVLVPARLPPKSPSHYLLELEKNQIPKTAALLRRHIDDI